MRNIHLVEQFMKENGLKYNELFSIKEDGEIKQIKIIKEPKFAVIQLDSNGKYHNWGFPIAYLYKLLFRDDIEIIKKPWKPKYDDIYWYASIDGRVYSTAWTEHNNDMHRYILGNCFKTKEEAKKHKTDIFKMLHGEPLVKWEE